MQEANIVVVAIPLPFPVLKPIVLLDVAIVANATVDGVAASATGGIHMTSVAVDGEVGEKKEVAVDVLVVMQIATTALTEAR